MCVCVDFVMCGCVDCVDFVMCGCVDFVMFGCVDCVDFVVCGCFGNTCFVLLVVCFCIVLFMYIICSACTGVRTAATE